MSAALAQMVADGTFPPPRHPGETTSAPRVGDGLVRLDATGKVQHARLGISVQEVNQTLADSFNLDKPEGALVSSVEKGGPADKGPANATEDERKAAGWVAQAQFAFDNVQKVLEKSPNANRPVLAAEVAGMLPGKAGRAAQNSLTPEARQQFEQAANSFAEAALRAATGAGVNRDEAQQKVAELTPQIGDQPKTIQQKKEAWGVYLESLRMRAGRALPPSLADAARGATARPGAASAPSAPQRNVTVTY